MRSSTGVLSLLVALALPLAIRGLDIGVKITGGPSSKPQTRCFEHETIERGDIVVMHFNAYYHETSPSGEVGKFITGSKEHAEGGLAVPIGDPKNHAGWDLALLGLCEGDRVTLKVPPKYIQQGEAFADKNVPEDAVVQIDVHIVDILVETSDSDSDDQGNLDSDSDEGEL